MEDLAYVGIGGFGLFICYVLSIFMCMRALRSTCLGFLVGLLLGSLGPIGVVIALALWVLASTTRPKQKPDGSINIRIER